MKQNFFMFLAATALTFVACNGGGDYQNNAKSSQNDAQTKPLANIILDTDIGSSTDDLLTMDVMYRMMDAGLLNLKAVMVNREGINFARMTDIMNTYYGHPDIPIGMVHDGPKDPKVFIDYWKMADNSIEPDANFKRSRTDEELRNLPAAEKLYRKILAESPDKSVYVFSIGFATNIAHLLQSTGDEYSPLSGVELVKQKCAALYIQAGHFGNNDEPDYNFLLDKESSKILVSQWPSDIYFSPMEAGQMFDYRPDSLLNDYADAKLLDSPIYHAYNHHQCDTGQRMWDVLTILQFLYPDLFVTYGPTKYDLDDNMVMHLDPSKTDGNHYMMFPKTKRSQEVIIDMIRWFSSYTVKDSKRPASELIL